MPLSQLDPVAALVVIDLQKGIVNLPFAGPKGDVVNNAGRLTEAFRNRQLPVVLVNVAGRAPGRTDAAAPKLPISPDFADLIPELNHQPDDYRVTKKHPGAFLGTQLDDFLKKKGVTQVFIIGIATSIGVEATARSAYDLGYNVVLVTDAMSDMSAEAHEHSVQKVFPRIAETADTESVLALLR